MNFVKQIVKCADGNLNAMSKSLTVSIAKPSEQALCKDKTVQNYFTYSTYYLHIGKLKINVEHVDTCRISF